MIQQFADWLIYDIFGLDATSRLGEAVNFFVYDSTKIILLLFAISIVMGLVNAYFPIERLRNYLSSHQLYGFQYLLASIFGAITPFCSCSSIPLFIGFVKGGIPLGVTFAFLITSPLVNEVAVAMFLGTFGWQVTAIYVVCGILMGMVGGFVLGKLKRTYDKLLISSSSGSSSIFASRPFGESPRMPFVFRYMLPSSHIASLVSSNMTCRSVVQSWRSCEYWAVLCLPWMTSENCLNHSNKRMKSMTMGNSVLISNTINIF